MARADDWQDGALVAAAAEGNQVATGHLLVKHGAMLERCIRSSAPKDVSGVETDDVLQETFIQVARDLAKFRGSSDAEFRAWLVRIAENRLTEAIRAAKRLKRGGNLHRVSTGGGSSSIQQLINLIARTSGTASRSAVRRETAREVQAHVATLPEAEREALVAYYLGGQSLAEIGSDMQRSPGSIKGLLDRARKRIRALLGSVSLYRRN